jgi:hypothetical protein
MAEFQWWLLIVGLVAGGGLVAVILMDGSRREADVDDKERAAEATFIARWLRDHGRAVDRDDVEAVLDAHRDYLQLPPPDHIESAVPELPVGAADPVPAAGPVSADADADRPADEVRDDGRGGADEDLASA